MQIYEFPNRREREADERLLAVAAELEAMGITVVEAEPDLLAQFMRPANDAERRAFLLIAGVDE